jgi:hypothetical protein
MRQEDIVVKQSPFIFIKYIIIVEFLFALIPLLVVQLLGAQANYETAGLARTLPYGWLVTIIVTCLQVLILTLTFVAWYFPAYHIDQQEIIYKRGGLYQDTKLIELREVADIGVRQRWLGKKLNYGSLIILSGTREYQATMKNVPGPSDFASVLDGLVHSLKLGHVSDSDLPTRETPALPALVKGGENQFVEFKASLVWDYRREIPNKELYTPVMKNIVAFMNSDGGNVLVGVSDDCDILGIEPDLKTMQKRNIDGFENIFNMAFNKIIGVEFRQYVSVTFPVIEDLIICRLTVFPSGEPAYLQYKGDERFYIRAGNASQPLPVRKATNYIRSHFKA